jgi:RNA polymerase sigma-70 factor (ECF subfamily)
MTAIALNPDGQLVLHLPWLHAFALQLCGRPDEAADLVQEAMVRGLRGVRALPQDSNLRAWLRRILWNLFVDRWRRQTREAVDLVTDVDAIPANDDQAEPEPRWSTIGDEELRAAVDSLETPFRGVYKLHAEGHDYQSISRRLGVPAATVGTRLHRARKKLRVLLESRQRCAAADSA